MFQAAAARMAASSIHVQSQRSPSVLVPKRGADEQLTAAIHKKPKHLASSHVQVQPQPLKPSRIHISTILTHPLTNVERWRMRGWTWPEAMYRVGNSGDEGCTAPESPRGTSFWVEIGREVQG